MTDSTVGKTPGALAGPETAADERVTIPVRELELIQQIEAMRSGRAAQWKLCPMWNDGCRCVPVFKCQKGETTTRLDGPETAAEHVRNALQLLELPVVRLSNFHEAVPSLLESWVGPPIVGEVAIHFQENIEAARARLALALAVLEHGGAEPRRGSADNR